MRPTTYLSLHPGEDSIASLDLLDGGLDRLTHAAVGDLRRDEGRGTERQGKDGSGSGQSSRDHCSCCSFQLTLKVSTSPSPSSVHRMHRQSAHRTVPSARPAPPAPPPASIALTLSRRVILSAPHRPRRHGQLALTLSHQAGQYLIPIYTRGLCRHLIYSEFGTRGSKDPAGPTVCLGVVWVARRASLTRG